MTSNAGGAGAARELVERILRVQGLWEGIVDAYLHEPADAGTPSR